MKSIKLIIKDHQLFNNETSLLSLKNIRLQMDIFIYLIIKYLLWKTVLNVAKKLSAEAIKNSVMMAAEMPITISTTKTPQI